jgi:serine/threonine-protein kinase
LRSRRPGLSLLLVAGAGLLIVSILIGERLGDRVMLQTAERAPVASELVTAVPDAAPTDARDPADWKRLQVIAVATDPGFPDPRVTRPPAPRPPATRSPTPTPAPTPARRRVPYTPPPLALPLVSHAPGEVETEPPGPSPTSTP